MQPVVGRPEPADEVKTVADETVLPFTLELRKGAPTPHAGTGYGHNEGMLDTVPGVRPQNSSFGAPGISMSAAGGAAGAGCSVGRTNVRKRKTTAASPRSQA